MQFVDEAEVIVRAGHGGAGNVSFHREKFYPRGGPDGGDGGRGGDVVLLASGKLETLLDYRYRARYEAPDGAAGGTSNKTGPSGADLILPLPVGTLVYDAQGALLVDLDHDGLRHVIARGGRGGLGNARFKTSRRQAPDKAQPGEAGEERALRLELRVLADFGLVGLPNAGKSTLISRISAARPRVADYPFTTLAPNLGLVQHQGRRFIVADLPGLIEGAHEGRGLGDRFLRHLSRTRALVYVLAVDGDPAPPEAFELLRAEVASHSAELLERPCLVVLSKIDLASASSPAGEALPDWTEALAAISGEGEVAPLTLSSHTGQGVEALLSSLVRNLPPKPDFDPSRGEPGEGWSPGR